MAMSAKHILAALAVSNLTPAGLHAQLRCGPHDQVAAGLAARYAERPVASALTSRGALLEVFATADGQTWTMLLTDPRGRSCLLAEGQAWRRAAPPAEPET